MYKRSRAKASDGHSCDSISELIIDNWLTENNISHQVDVLYPKTEHKADWSIETNREKVFVEYFGLAGDSARYDQTIKEKKNFVKGMKSG